MSEEKKNLTIPERIQILEERKKNYEAELFRLENIKMALAEINGALQMLYELNEKS
jgi:hypothetical protein